MNAANEEAVQAFIDERICLTDIPRVIEAVMDGHQTKAVSDLSVVLEADGSARVLAQNEIQKLAGPSRFRAEKVV
jgi:1-deoxy-D-xylulose-5-phosphate reductoisomerase